MGGSFLHRKNKRKVYKDNDGNYWSQDTRHGEYEKHDKRGKHIDAYDTDLNPKDKHDNSGQHDIEV